MDENFEEDEESLSKRPMLMETIEERNGNQELIKNELYKEGKKSVFLEKKSEMDEDDDIDGSDDEEESIHDIGEGDEDAYTEEDGSIGDSDLNDTSTDSSIDDMDEGNTKVSRKIIKEQFDKLMKETETGFVDYEKCKELCKMAEESGSLERIRLAYQRFAKAYPLSPDIWERYIDIETTNIETDNDIIEIENLHKKALKDYYSVDLASRYLVWAEYSSDPDKIYKTILPVYGLNYMHGKQLYDRYREYLSEREPLEQRESSVDSDLKPGQSVQHFLESFIQQISQPILGFDKCYSEFKVLYERYKDQLTTEYNIDLNIIEKTYTETKSLYDIITPFEESLNAVVNEGTNRSETLAPTYREYIFTLKKAMAREENSDSIKNCIFLLILTIYERMVLDCWSDETCWLDYIDYRLQTRRDKRHSLFSADIITNCVDELSKKSLRNCFWSVRLYSKRMKILEILHRDQNEIKAVLEDGLAACSQTPQNTIKLWLDYLTLLRRLTDFKDEESCQFLRKNFTHAWTAIGQQWKDIQADPNFEILQMWACLESGPLKNAQRAKEILSLILENREGAAKSKIWLQYVNLEINSGDLDTARRLFEKALCVEDLDDKCDLANAWERFERCYGTNKTLEICLKQCEVILTYVKRNFDSTNSTLIESRKRKIGNVTKNNRSSNSYEPTKKMARTNMSINENTRKTKAYKIENNKNNQIDVVDRRNDAKTPQSHNNSIHKESSEWKVGGDEDKLRIFLSNLDYNLNEDEIRNGLPDLNITDIELVRSGNGRSRGFAYAKLPNEEEVKKALTLDRSFVCGRPIFISTVTRDKDQRQKFKFSGELEPCKLFVRGLPPDTTKEDLEKFFNPHGAVKDIRLVYHKSGKFKNLAYVEYENETSASKAVLATDQSLFKQNTISVAISAPPIRPTSDADTKVDIRVGNSFSGSRHSNRLHEQRPRMSLIPTAVRKNYLLNKSKEHDQDKCTTTLSNDKNEPNSETKQKSEESSRKSNDDFRKMLLP